MKSALKKIPLFWLFACTFCLIFVSCKKDDDDDVKTVVKAELPASVGMNELENTTWEKDNVIWSFRGASTAKKSEEYAGYVDTDNFSYSYDSGNKLLYLSLESMNFGDNSISSETEYVNFMKKEIEAEGRVFNERDKLGAESEAKDLFGILRIYKYSKGADHTLTLEEYFPGSLPTHVEFKDSTDDPNSDYNIKIEGSSGVKLRTSGHNKTWIYKMNYNNGSFSGTAVTDGIVLGTVTGTYTVFGAGTSGSSITLRFTDLPGGLTEISDFETNKDYTLTQIASSKSFDSAN